MYNEIDTKISQIAFTIEVYEGRVKSTKSSILLQKSKISQKLFCNSGQSSKKYIK